MKICEIRFFKHLEGEDTSLDIKLKNNCLLFIFNHKISNWNLKLTAKTMETSKHFSRNYDFAFTKLFTKAADIYVK